MDMLKVNKVTLGDQTCKQFRTASLSESSHLGLDLPVSEEASNVLAVSSPDREDNWKIEPQRKCSKEVQEHYDD